MMERSVPWWRRALKVALGGIRSGFGLFRRNGKAATGAEVALEVGAAAQRPEAERDETEAVKEESRVNPSSPHPEPTAAKEPTAPNEVAAAKSEPSANAVPHPTDEPVSQPSVPTNQLPAATVTETKIPTVPMSARQAVEANEPTESKAAETEPFEAAVAEVQTVEAVAAEAPDVATEPPVAEEPAPAPPGETSDTVEPAPAPESQTVAAEQPTAIAAAAENPAVAETKPVAIAAQAAPEPLPAAPEPAPQEIAPTLPFAEKPERTTAEKVAAALKARGESAEQSPFSVIVNEVYDGPLDLLLDLIRKQDIDIYDIPIAKITAQFLAYVDQLRAGDMDVAGEFIYTAALLIHIKSKMLLPRAPAGPDDAAEDPRRELVERLLEHERFKNAAQMLLQKQMLEAATWSNPGIREFQEDAGAEPEIAADTTDLVRVFSGILERARNRPILNVEEDSVTVGQMIQFLARRLTMEDKPVALRRMLSHTRSERALIAMFLALLELVRLQAILLRQDRHFSEIFIKKHTGFDAMMNQGLSNARDDWR
jgi:segregation and condensation protein A